MISAILRTPQVVSTLTTKPSCQCVSSPLSTCLCSTRCDLTNNSVVTLNLTSFPSSEPLLLIDFPKKYIYTKMSHSLFYPLTYETSVACDFFPYLTSTSSRETNSIFYFFLVQHFGHMFFLFVCLFCSDCYYLVQVLVNS